MSGARRSERLRTANRRTCVLHDALCRSDVLAQGGRAPLATVARSPSIPPGGGRRVQSCFMSRGDRFRGSLRVRDKRLDQGISNVIALAEHWVGGSRT